MSLGYYARLEPRTRADDLAAGLAARVYDATWLLARQWQLGELTGDDGGTPAGVRHLGARTWCTAWADAAGTHPLAQGEGPLEALLEPGPTPPLTLRRRVDLGRALLRALRDAGLDDRIPALLTAFPLADPTDPTDPDDLTDPGGPVAGRAGRAAGMFAVAAGRVPDGGAALATLGPTLRAEPPGLPAVPDLTVDDELVKAGLAWLADCDALLGRPAADAWDESRLSYAATMDAPAPDGGVRFGTTDHGGGSLDWWAFDADPLPPDPAATAEPYDVTVMPTRASFRGMPVPRWWQEEDAAVDLAGVEAHPADLARMALLQFALVFGNDHFVLPVALPVGAVFRTTHLLVTDTFGATFALSPAGHTSPGGRRAEGASRWTMFTPTLADGRGVADVFLLPATALHQLTGKPVEDVHLLRDEMANLAWAVESVVEGEHGRPDRRTERPHPAQPDQPATGPLRYRLGTGVPAHWFPLAPTRTATGDIPELVLQPMAHTTGPDAVPRGTFLRFGLTVDDDRIPREGRRLLREHVLTRWTDGTPVTWSRRRSTIGRGEGSSGLTFDTVDPT